MINFSQLYTANIDSLLNFGCKFTSDREMIKDCIQDVFVKLYVKREELDGVENIKSYLFIALKNRLNDEFRHNSFFTDTDVDEAADHNTIYYDVENKYLNNESEHSNELKVQHYFSQLSPRQRKALNLYYIEERKYMEICEIMGMNYQSVRNLMHRSLLRLRGISSDSMKVCAEVV